MFTGYLLSSTSRSALLKQFPPQNERLIAHHITERFGVNRDEPAPDMPHTVQVVGHANINGVELLTVTVDGKSERPDGKLYHITWSLAEGRKPVDSNNYADKAGKLPNAISIAVEPKNFHH